MILKVGLDAGVSVVAVLFAGAALGHGPKHNPVRHLPMITDGYLMWTLLEGGEPLETAMPAFKEVLSDSERWQIIRYLNGGFPSS
ncbi:MAG: c-type cytochrome [Hyphomicrobiales bacterium]